MFLCFFVVTFEHYPQVKLGFDLPVGSDLVFGFS